MLTLKADLLHAIDLEHNFWNNFKKIKAEIKDNYLLDMKKLKHKIQNRLEELLHNRNVYISEKERDQLLNTIFKKLVAIVAKEELEINPL
ncbi:hypothetical protein ACFLQ1_01480 [Candidatus Auribacterota bacterium]